MKTLTPFGIYVETVVVEIDPHAFFSHKLVSTAANWKAEFLLLKSEINDENLLSRVHKSDVKDFLRYAITACLQTETF